jgi:hypothetical protein
MILAFSALMRPLVWLKLSFTSAASALFVEIKPAKAVMVKTKPRIDKPMSDRLAEVEEYAIGSPLAEFSAERPSESKTGSTGATAIGNNSDHALCFNFNIF